MKSEEFREVLGSSIVEVVEAELVQTPVQYRDQLEDAYYLLANDGDFENLEKLKQAAIAGNEQKLREWMLQLHNEIETMWESINYVKNHIKSVEAKQALIDYKHQQLSDQVHTWMVNQSQIQPTLPPSQTKTTNFNFNFSRLDSFVVWLLVAPLALFLTAAGIQFVGSMLEQQGSPGVEQSR